MKKTVYNLEEIKKKIEKYNYISFDIFDTLIKRNVKKPSDIFKLTAIEYEKETNVLIPNYKELRIEAEFIAKPLCDGEEPDIDDIFNNIKLDKNQYDINKLKEIEINLELLLCQRNNYFYPIYEYCVKNNKKIIITSDMYLNKKYIEKILKNAGIYNYDYLFLSNEVKLNKRIGKIYTHVLKEINIKPKQLLHIGDSKRGDYLQARLHGINSILIRKKLKTARYEGKSKRHVENLQENTLSSYINNNIDLNQSSYYNIGYEVLGPLLYGYSKWITDTIKSLDINKIFFLAREGNLLKKATDIVKESSLKTEYLYISRRSVRPALLECINSYEELARVIKIKPTTTVEKFLKDIGLYDKKHIDILNQYNYFENVKIQELSNISEMFELLKSDMKANAVQEKKNIIGYLHSMGFCDNIAISDVGWAGSMQKSLTTIFKQHRIAGFYMATTHEIPNIELYSYLDNYEKIRPFVHLFENLFLAQHGTTLKYDFKNNKYIPVLAEYEYTQEEKEIFMEIQKGALQFVREFNSSNLNSLIKIEPRIAFKRIEKLGLNPTIKDLQLFKNIHYIETVKLHLVEGKGLFYYVFNIKKIKEDLFNSGWKIGFLKNLLKIKLPYYKIYNFLTKYREQ